MTVKQLEQRVLALERQVKELQSERGLNGIREHFDWDSVVEEFKGDEDILAVLAEAMKLREKERRAVRRTSRQSRSRS